MVAPEGNQNARKPSAGIQINFYLTAEEKDNMRKVLLSIGEEPTDKAIREYARLQSRNGIHLALDGKCDVPDCYQSVSVECRIGHCAPLKRYCAYHYEQIHLPPEVEPEEVFEQ